MPHTMLILAVLSRDTHLYRVPGFLEFHLLRRPERDDHVLCSSHTVWASKAAFTGWTQFEPFRAPIVTQAPTSRSISAIPSSRASRQSRRSRIQMRGIRPPERRPVAIDAWRFLYYISLAKRPSSQADQLELEGPPDDGGELIVCAVRSGRFDPFAMWANNRCLRANRPSGVGRVGVWRDGVRLSMSVCRPFRLAVP